MYLSQRLIASLWWGPARRPFEYLARRLLKKRQQILAGPLAGCAFQGGLSQMLGIYEFPVQQMILGALHSGAVFYDVGAYNGYLSLLAAKTVGSTGKVFSFEPFPPNAERVAAAIQANRIENWQLVQTAVMDYLGDARLHFSGNGSGTTPSIFPGGKQGEVDVDAQTLDHFIQSHSLPDLVKVDVEGAEAAVLRGSRQLLASSNPPKWLLEIHNEGAYGEARAILEAHGYRLQRVRAWRKRRQAYPFHLFASKSFEFEDMKGP